MEEESDVHGEDAMMILIDRNPQSFFAALALLPVRKITLHSYGSGFPAKLTLFSSALLRSRHFLQYDGIPPNQYIVTG